MSNVCVRHMCALFHSIWEAEFLELSPPITPRLSRVSFLVENQVIRSRERSLAHVTLERFFACVHPRVPRELIRAAKTSIAVAPRALVRPLSCVSPNVRLQMGALGVSLRAHRTLVPPLCLAIFGLTHEIVEFSVTCGYKRTSGSVLLKCSCFRVLINLIFKNVHLLNMPFHANRKSMPIANRKRYHVIAVGTLQPDIVLLILVLDMIPDLVNLPLHVEMETNDYV